MLNLPEIKKDDDLFGRGTHRATHEADRKGRQISFTFPSPEWIEALDAWAQEWEMDRSELILYLLSLGLSIRGQMVRPEGQHRGPSDRLGDTWDLPWRP